ncbi:MAG TPA: group III truncated hemoglobin [Pararhizobium sp.]|nr:group III truncated hemoglobin [Pararhizobium sp.]
MSDFRSDMEARRRQLADRVVAATAIDEAMIERLVHAFYDRVRTDPLLGPIFDAKVEDWDEHLARMCTFWSSVVLLSGRYHGQPMAKHLPLPVEGHHFERWLGIFDETAGDVCPPAAAEYFSDRAHRIAASLEAGVATVRNRERVEV